LTNLVLAYLLLVVLLLFGSIIVLSPFDSATQILTLLGLIFGGTLVGAFLVGVIQVKLLTKESIWLKPASESVGTILINSVVFVWLCGIGFLIFVILKATESTAARAGVIFVLLAGAGLGRYLQKRFWSSSWLGYGISFVAVLLVIVAGAVASVLLKS
jgi:hypothetical protein